MSVSVVDNEIYERIATKLKTFIGRTTVDVNYCSEFANKTETEVEQFVKDLLYLNEVTYNLRYNDTTKKGFWLFKFLTFKRTEVVSTVQLFKWLEAIEYNIDIKDIRKVFIYNSQNLPNFESYELLLKAEKSLSHSIIKHYTDYDKLSWSELK